MALTVGSRLGHYDVTALIGEGGMGEVRMRCPEVAFSHMTRSPRSWSATTAIE